MQQTINIYPVLATWKASKKTGLCPIHLSVDINGKRAAFPSLKRKILPTQWDAEKKKVVRHPNASLLNAYIEKETAKHDAEFLRKQLLGIKVTRQLAKSQVKGTTSGQDFYQFCREQVKNYPNKETRRTYNSEITKLEQYAPSLTFSDIDYNFLQGYSNWMREVRKNEPNTIFKTFKFMHTMLELAKMPSFRLIQTNPFDEFDRGKYQQGIPDYLEWDEVQLLFNTLRLSVALSSQHRTLGYYFLLSCCAGFRFGDCIRFNYDTYVTHTADGPRLILRTTKAGEIVSIAFTPDIAEVVEYIKDKPVKISNQDFNRQLKVIGSIAGIKKPLKSHMGRHTFAMRLAELGFSEDDAQHLLGHRDKKSTKIYFRIKNTRLDAELKTKWVSQDQIPKLGL